MKIASVTQLHGVHPTLCPSLRVGKSVAIGHETLALTSFPSGKGVSAGRAG